ncbi:hypothetical protein DRE_05046 [Drechslerella stenobrocha 248]|uniref:Pre-mRNA-splicing factor cwf18 n=1 Tax=Drechslerella stenobrocha 248 TaxID=1043628 RepID=W7HRA7_9PEZI|nr:hypothetical protein DRE_05046 [Drechslerella stenobrocha 248]
MDISLEAQVGSRKDRLAKLRGMKRKQEGTEAMDFTTTNRSGDDSEIDASAAILSGRNYDVEAKAPRLGYDLAPSDQRDTLESQAASIAAEARNAIRDEDKTDRVIDLLSIQPKKPNWDLKRDVDQRMTQLERLTNNAIAQVLRDRILQSQTAGAAGSENLAELVRQREKEEEEAVIADGDLTLA